MLGLFCVHVGDRYVHLIAVNWHIYALLKGDTYTLAFLLPSMASLRRWCCDSSRPDAPANA